MLRRTALIALAALVAAPSPARASGTVTVYAAASLREAFEAMVPGFRARSGYDVRFDFAGSDALATRIANGAPADVFASANEAQMQRIGSAARDVQTLARNHIVVAVPAGSPIRAIAGLARAGTKVVLAAPGVPVGDYARRALAALDGRPGYGNGWARRVLANVVSEELDVKAVTAKLALGEADAGIVYATDITPPLFGKLRTLAFPAGAAPVAVYPIATLRESSSLEGARAFVTYATRGPGRIVLRARGFTE